MSRPYKQVDTLSVDCPNYQECLGFLIVLHNGSHTIIACSSHKQECRGLVKLASYHGTCQACRKDIKIKSHLISRHIDSSKWVHFKCREAVLPEVETELSAAEEDTCLWCDGIISPGEGKQCSYGDRIGFRHVKCKRVTTADATSKATAPVIFGEDKATVERPVSNKKARRSSSSSSSSDDDDPYFPSSNNTSMEFSQSSSPGSAVTTSSDTELGKDDDTQTQQESTFDIPAADPATASATVTGRTRPRRN